MSYLIYTRAFDGLPPEAKDRVYLRLYEVLTGKDTSEPFCASFRIGPSSRAGDLAGDETRTASLLEEGAGWQGMTNGCPVASYRSFGDCGLSWQGVGMP